MFFLKVVLLWFYGYYNPGKQPMIVVLWLCKWDMMGISWMQTEDYTGLMFISCEVIGI
jgi:hypothetical protein